MGHMAGFMGSKNAFHMIWMLLVSMGKKKNSSKSKITIIKGITIPTYNYVISVGLGGPKQYYFPLIQD